MNDKDRISNANLQKVTDKWDGVASSTQSCLENVCWDTSLGERMPYAQARASADPGPPDRPLLLPPTPCCALWSFPYPHGADAPAQSVHI